MSDPTPTCDHPLGPGSQGALCTKPKGHDAGAQLIEHSGSVPPEGRMPEAIAESFFADQLAAIDRLLKPVSAAKQGSPEAPEVIYTGFGGGGWEASFAREGEMGRPMNIRLPGQRLESDTRYVRGDIAEEREAELTALLVRSWKALRVPEPVGELAELLDDIVAATSNR